MQKIGRYASLFLAMTAVGYALLLGTGLLSQQKVFDSVCASAGQLSAEGETVVPLIRNDETYLLDNNTEAKILLHSLYMNVHASPSYVLINPARLGEQPINEIVAMAENGYTDDVDSYGTDSVMGFRSVIRLLLTFMNFKQIRRFIMWIVLLLFAGNAMNMQKRFGVLLSFLFTISFLAINPLSVMSSIRYACCFIIAFAGMLLVPLVRRSKSLTEPMAFFLIGGITQYFDLYTVPLITFALPMIVLLLEKQRDGELLTFREDLVFTGRCLAAWLAAYAGVWLLHVALTTWLTDFHAWQTATRAISQTVFSGNVLSALSIAFNNLVTIEFVLSLIVLVIAWPFMVDTRAKRKKGYRQGRIFLCLALLPLLWIAVAAQPMVDNGYFQYRVLIATILPVFCAYAKPTQYLEKQR